ncbi:MAG TPA: hypothetical protein VEQ59_20325, partial [Polyangiaceae bacterium]|nr:hypothetical protein [Polyangiaceae bacterium]
MRRRDLLPIGVALACGSRTELEPSTTPGRGSRGGGTGSTPSGPSLPQSSASASWGVFSATRYASTTGAGVGPELTLGNS